MNKEIFYTTYSIATNFLGGDFILLNDIINIDKTIFDNMRFDYYDEETGREIDIYQWYITSYSESDIEYLEKAFPDLLFTYSGLLDCYILCVDHYGTNWKGVLCECSKEWAEYNKSLIITEENKTPELKRIRTY